MKKIVRILCGMFMGVLFLASSFTAKAMGMEMNHSQLVVDSYEIVEGKFEQGAECIIRIHISNIDNDSIAKAGGITIYSSYIFAVTGKTNQISFGEIKPGQSISVDFEVNLDRIVVGPNLLEIELNWLDENENTYTNAVAISPVLLEKVSFDITAVKIPETVYGKKNTTMSVSYENSGDEELQNVCMVIEGDIAQGVQEIHLEDIAAKEKSMADCPVELLNEGKNAIRVYFRYEDRNGTLYSTDPVEVTVLVADKAYSVPAEQEMNFEMIFAEYRVYIIAAVAAVVLCIPFLVELIKKGGKKR